MGDEDIMPEECDKYWNISEENVSKWLFTQGDGVFITIIIPIICGFGVITNLGFLCVVFCVPKMRSGIYVYLSQLAVADSLYLSLTSAYFIWSYAASPVFHHFPFSNSGGCMSFFTVRFTSIVASVALITMALYDLYLTLCHPLKHRVVHSWCRTCRITVGCWLVGLLGGVSLALDSSTAQKNCLQWPHDDMYQELPTVVIACTPAHPNVVYYSGLLFTVPWLFVIFAVVYMCIRISRALRERKAINKRRQVLQNQRQMTRMIVSNIAICIMCQIPALIRNVSVFVASLTGVPKPGAAWRGSLWLSVVFQLLNSAVNPLLYGAINAQCRAAFLRALSCRKRKPEDKDADDSKVKIESACNTLPVHQINQDTNMTWL
ncbi:olfactory receptor 13-like [Acanthaster planci]|uniref:Olfactory receptor 13-like n=1 Tax=Acanthaster planci TaxID=133434 RepID=A0A8B7Y1A7_ACAPL|nr:olfactory receptor 13-like [Acanthaster planci]